MQDDGTERIGKKNTAIALDGDEVSLDGLLKSDVSNTNLDTLSASEADAAEDPETPPPRRIDTNQALAETVAQAHQEEAGPTDTSRLGTQNSAIACDNDVISLSAASASQQSLPQPSPSCASSAAPSLNGPAPAPSVNGNDSVFEDGKSASDIDSQLAESRLQKGCTAVGNDNDVVSVGTSLSAADPSQAISESAGDISMHSEADSSVHSRGVPPDMADQRPKDPVALWHKLGQFWDGYNVCRDKMFPETARAERGKSGDGPNDLLQSYPPFEGRLSPEPPRDPADSLARTASPTDSKNIVSKLQALANLLGSGLLSPEEYAAAKQLVLDDVQDPALAAIEAQQGVGQFPLHTSTHTRGVPTLASHLPQELAEVLATKASTPRNRSPQRSTQEGLMLASSVPSAGPGGWVPEDLQATQRAAPQRTPDAAGPAAAPQPVEQQPAAGLVPKLDTEPLGVSGSVAVAPQAPTQPSLLNPAMEAAIAALMTTTPAAPVAPAVPAVPTPVVAERDVRTPSGLPEETANLLAPPVPVAQSSTSTSLPVYAAGASVPEQFLSSKQPQDEVMRLMSSVKETLAVQKNPLLAKLKHLKDSGLLTEEEYRECLAQQGVTSDPLDEMMRDQFVKLVSQPQARQEGANPAAQQRPQFPSMQPFMKAAPSMPASQLPYTALPAVTPTAQANQLFAELNAHPGSLADLRAQFPGIPDNVLQAIKEAEGLESDAHSSTAETTTLPTTPGTHPGQKRALRVQPPVVQTQVAESLHGASSVSSMQHVNDAHALHMQASQAVPKARKSSIRSASQRQTPLQAHTSLRSNLPPVRLPAVSPTSGAMQRFQQMQQPQQAEPVLQAETPTVAQTPAPQQMQQPVATLKEPARELFSGSPVAPDAAMRSVSPSVDHTLMHQQILQQQQQQVILQQQVQQLAQMQHTQFFQQQQQAQHDKQTQLQLQHQLMQQQSQLHQQQQNQFVQHASMQSMQGYQPSPTPQSVIHSTPLPHHQTAAPPLSPQSAVRVIKTPPTQGTPTEFRYDPPQQAHCADVRSVSEVGRIDTRRPTDVGYAVHAMHMPADDFQAHASKHEEMHLKRRLRDSLSNPALADQVVRLGEALHATNPTALLAVLSEVQPNTPLTLLAQEWHTCLHNCAAQLKRAQGRCVVLPSLAGKGPFRGRSISPRRPDEASDGCASSVSPGGLAYAELPQLPRADEVLNFGGHLG